MRKTLAALAIIAMVFSVAWAASTPSVTVQWTMPTVNLDGTPLTDLAGAKVYYGTAYNTAGLESDFCTEMAKVATKSGSVIRLAADRPPRRLWIGRE